MSHAENPNPPAAKPWEQPAEPSNDEARHLAERRAQLEKIWLTSQARQEKDKKSADGHSATKQGREGLTEREKSRERAAEIVLRDGGVRVNISIDKPLSPQGNAGFQRLETRIQDGQQSWRVVARVESNIRDRTQGAYDDPLDKLKELHIREILDIRAVEDREEEETVIVRGSRGFLGLGQTPDRQERRGTGRRRPTLHSEVVEGGKQEPAVRFTYYVPQTDEWRDYSGRGGNMMSAEIVVPESAARELERIVERDPAAIRTVVERVMKEKLLKDPAAWETRQGSGDPLRPPYEAWDAEPGGGTLYLQKEGQTPGFHPERVRKIKN